VSANTSFGVIGVVEGERLRPQLYAIILNWKG